MLWRAFQVPAHHVTHLLGVVYCQLNFCKSSWMYSMRNGGSLRIAYVTTPWIQIVHVLLCSPVTLQLLQFRQGYKVICAPCVRRLFHQSSVGQSSHDLCSWLLGSAGLRGRKPDTMVTRICWKDLLGILKKCTQNTRLLSLRKQVWR